MDFGPYGTYCIMGIAVQRDSGFEGFHCTKILRTSTLQRLMKYKARG